MYIYIVYIYIYKHTQTHRYMSVVILVWRAMILVWYKVPTFACAIALSRFHECSVLNLMMTIRD